MRVLGGMSGPKRKGVTGKLMNPCSDELQNLNASPNFITVINSRRMRLV
jgi:hypothetical protein